MPAPVMVAPVRKPNNLFYVSLEFTFHASCVRFRLINVEILDHARMDEEFQLL
jgi:hypothetical protein